MTLNARPATLRGSAILTATETNQNGLVGWVLEWTNNDLREKHLLGSSFGQLRSYWA